MTAPCFYGRTLEGEQTKVTADDKNKFESLEKLRDASWKSFDRRRELEWKISLVVWTSLAVVTGAIWSNKTSAFPSSAWIYCTAVGVLVITIHWFWLAGVVRGHNADRRVMIHFRNEMMSLLKTTFPEDLDSELTTIRGTWTHNGRNWSVLLSVLITALLAAATVISVYTKADKTARQTTPAAWEYRFVAGEPGGLNNEAEKLASEGFEVVSLAPSGEKGGLVLMRRPRLADKDQTKAGTASP